MNSFGFKKGLTLHVLCLLFIGFLSAQPPKNAFSGTPLSEIFQLVERHFGVSLNYDVEAVNEYSFSGTLPFDQLEGTLDVLLAATHFTYQIAENSILIYPGKKQFYRVCGTLIDQATQEPLAFASVVLGGTKRGVNTDETGKFDFQVEAYVHQFIHFRYLGYATIEIPVQSLEATGCSTYSLRTEDTYVDPIVIEDYLLPGIKEGSAYGSLNVDFLRLSQNYTGQEHDVLKTVQILPGITSVDETSANLSIRGSTPDQNLILWEGATLYDPGHIFGMISSISPFVVDKVKIYKGVFDPQYDNRVGGIVDISLSDKISSRTRAGLGATLTEAHTFVDIPLIKDKLSILLSGRHTLSNIFDSPTLGSYSQRVFQATKVEDGQEEEDEEEVRIEQRLNYFDLNGKLLFRPIDKLLLKAAYFHSKNDFFYDFQATEASFQTQDQVEYMMETLSLEGQFSWNEQHQSTFSWVYSDYKNIYGFSLAELQDSTFEILSNTTNAIRDQRYTLNHTWTVNSALKLAVGYIQDRKTVVFEFEERSVFEEDISRIDEVEGDFHDLYGSLTYKQKNIQLDAGVKATYFEQGEAWVYSPRASLQLSLSPCLKAKLSTGQLYQFISQLQDISSDELIGIANIWLLTDGEDDLLRARKFSLGALFNKAGWLLDVDAYIHSTRGLASISTKIGTGIEIDGDGQSETRGVDVLVKKQWDRYQFGLNYTWNINEYTFPEILPEAFPASNDIRHNLGITQSYALPNWEFSATYQYRSGLPYSIPNDVSPFVNDEGETYYELSFNQLNSGRLFPYHRLDLGVVYRKALKLKPWKFEASFSLINLFDRENVFSRETLLRENEETQEPEPFILEKSLLGLTPLVMVRVYWE
ncbi:MAG: FecR domain-containing protein [Bacteroidota bacterium]